MLNHLVRLGGAWSPLRLAKAFQLTKGAMTNTLQRLEKRGLIEVSPDPDDGRGKLVNITDAGREMRARCVAGVGPLLVDLADAATADGLSAALPVLERIRKRLDAHREG